MPSVIIKELNRSAFTTRETTDIAATFAAIEIDKQAQPVLIHSIGYGGNTVNNTDRPNYQSQWCAIVRNLSIDTTYSLLQPIAPINLPAGSEIVWMDMINGLNGNVHREFPEPFILPPGDRYMILSTSPYINGGFNGSIYHYVSLNAEVAQYHDANRAGKWRLR